MRKLISTTLLTAVLTLGGVGVASAHPQDPGGANGQGEGVGVIPAHVPNGHNGIECAAEAGSPTFPVKAEDVGLPFACPADRFED